MRLRGDPQDGEGKQLSPCGHGLPLPAERCRARVGLLVHFEADYNNVWAKDIDVDYLPCFPVIGFPEKLPR